jgi:ADP-ribose pyrophosphatase YjhB (NUDIX family)
LDRDPRFRVISVAYFALVNSTKLVLKADSDAGDTKYKKNLPMLNSESEFIDIVKKIINELKKLDFTGTPPSPAIEKLHAKRGTVYDPNAHVKSMIKDLSSWIDNIDKDHIATVIKGTKHYLTQDKLFPKQYLDDFERISSEYTKRKLSNVLDTGFAETRNRRYEVYKRLIPKLFKGWNIDMDDKYHVIILHKPQKDI